jgi:Rrf2 family transcriptional regulator, iron-sulfur cluster assembly transcription factor
MKISKQDDHGIRILLRIARSGEQEGLSLPTLVKTECLTQPHVAKITRELRLANLIKSNRGQKGGYVLAKSPAQITIKEIITALSGDLFEEGFFDSHPDSLRFCTNSVDCSVKSLWRVVKISIDKVLTEITLEDLLYGEEEAKRTLNEVLEELFAQRLVSVAS